MCTWEISVVFNRIGIHDLCDASAVCLPTQSYEATRMWWSQFAGLMGSRERNDEWKKRERMKCGWEWIEEMVLTLKWWTISAMVHIWDNRTYTRIAEIVQQINFIESVIYWPHQRSFHRSSCYLHFSSAFLFLSVHVLRQGNVVGVTKK